MISPLPVHQHHHTGSLTILFPLVYFFSKFQQKGRSWKINLRMLEVIRSRSSLWPFRAEARSGLDHELTAVGVQQDGNIDNYLFTVASPHSKANLFIRFILHRSLSTDQRRPPLQSSPSTRPRSSACEGCPAALWSGSPSGH